MLNVPETRTYEVYLREQMEEKLMCNRYSSKLIVLILRALHPREERRATVKDLINLLMSETVPNERIELKFHDEFNILKEIDALSLTQECEKSMKASSIMDEVTGKTKAIDVDSILIVEKKNSDKRFNAFCKIFELEEQAKHYRNSFFFQHEHDNLVTIHKSFIEPFGKDKYQLIFLKVLYIV
jgi:hypothetical protein